MDPKRYFTWYESAKRKRIVEINQRASQSEACTYKTYMICETETTSLCILPSQQFTTPASLRLSGKLKKTAPP